MKRIDKYVEAILTWVESRLPERWRSGKRRRLVRIWLIGLAASAAVTALSQTSYFEQKERAALDLVLKLTGRRLASDVVIENISLTKNYAQQFQELLRSRSFDDLLELMRGKVAGLRAKAAS